MSIALELQFIGWIAEFFDDVSQSSVQRRRELIDQLDRASLSALLNTAEGNGGRPGRPVGFFLAIQSATGLALRLANSLDPFT